MHAGLTKLLSQLTREGNWQKGLEVFESLHVLGVVPDTTITNAAISACDKGGQWEKALQVSSVWMAGLRTTTVLKGR
jgi:pentatricopeptide repeat protein